MNTSTGNLRVRNLRMLALLGGLFLLPLAVSFWMYYGTDWRPARRVNHGELISPARPLPQVALPPAIAGTRVPAELFQHKWSLVYIGNGRCDDACRQTLYVMRQTRLSLNNEMTRIERLFLVTADCCDRDFLAREHPGLAVLDATGAAAPTLLNVFPADGRDRTLFIVDPLGNLMMSYDSRQNPKGLLQDLKKLLTLSHIG
jgi:cytochrome oxidase Cu insertion factor (SCO1/SenC/PrrC family)